MALLAAWLSSLAARLLRLLLLPSPAAVCAAAAAKEEEGGAPAGGGGGGVQLAEVRLAGWVVGHVGLLLPTLGLVRGGGASRETCPCPC